MMTAGTEPATHESLYIGGAWAVAGETTAVLNPATGRPCAHVARGTADDTRAAIDAAASAFPGWGSAAALERAGVLRRVATGLREQAEPIGRLLATETGKLLAEGIGEVRFSADFFDFYAEEALRMERVVSSGGRPSGPQILARKPAGVAAALTPWNFPVSLQARKLAPALAAGCTVVARPSDEAPASVVALFRCLHNAGVPPGVANLVTGPAAETTAPALADPRVRVVSFTGSTEVGKALYRDAAPTMKRLALELGGCAPFVVCADADLELAAGQAMLAKFRNGGQSCVAANCFFVERAVYEPFVEALGERIGALRLGDQLDTATTHGPLINSRRREALEELLGAAVDGGFEPVAAAPELEPGDGLAPDCFLAPRLLAARSYRDVAPELLETEVFGPVALVAGFDDVGDLLERLNRNPRGLAGYVFSRDRAKAARIALALEVGIAGVNEGLAAAANMPMGGVKESGLGREGGHAALEEFLDMQYLALRGEPIGALGALG
jgi:succinate-semialdehyde dehydrogenase / glutarate-semialdehyde dehydrogenase